jgi:hypothetical protein
VSEGLIDTGFVHAIEKYMLLLAICSSDLSDSGADILGLELLYCSDSMKNVVGTCYSSAAMERYSLVQLVGVFILLVAIILRGMLLNVLDTLYGVYSNHTLSSSLSPQR